MPEYKIVDGGKLDADLKVFADAIRAKLGTQASLRFPDEMATAISQISSSASSANVAWGSVIPAQDYYGDDEYLTITHNLGVTPNFYIFAHNGELLQNDNDVAVSIVLDLKDLYITLEGTYYYTKGGGWHVDISSTGGYDDTRDSITFIPYTYQPGGHRIKAGEEYVWICGVLGEPFGELITFTIDGTTYQANEGMNWSDWVYSNYNTDGFKLQANEYGELEVHSASGARVGFGERPPTYQYGSYKVYAGRAYRTY